MQGILWDKPDDPDRCLLWMSGLLDMFTCP